MSNLSVSVAVVSLVALTLASGCSQESVMSVTSGLTPQRADLSNWEQQIVTDAVVVMLKGRGRTKITTMNGALVDGTDRTSVCGYVAYRAGDDGAVEQPYYVELGIENGVQAALRGQVASTPARRAKVEFMCRRSGLL